jgi:hypothetical protein
VVVFGARRPKLLVKQSPRAQSSPRSDPTRIHPRRSQAVASGAIERHFFDWPGRNAWKDTKAKSSAVVITESIAVSKGCNGATARRGSWAEFMLVSQLIRLAQEEWSPSQTLESIDSRVRDRGFWLQTGCIIEVFSCGEADRRFWVGLGKRGREHIVRHQAAERGKGWEKIKEEDSRVVGGVRLYRYWKRRLARIYALPNIAGAKPGRENTIPEITNTR